MDREGKNVIIMDLITLLTGCGETGSTGWFRAVSELLRAGLRGLGGVLGDPDVRALLHCLTCPCSMSRLMNLWVSAVDFCLSMKNVLIQKWNNFPLEMYRGLPLRFMRSSLIFCEKSTLTSPTMRSGCSSSMLMCESLRLTRYTWLS